jgi:hypothetical protein
MEPTLSKEDQAAVDEKSTGLFSEIADERVARLVSDRKRAIAYAQRIIRDNTVMLLNQNPDVNTFDADGEPVSSTYSQSVNTARQKSRDAIQAANDAITKAEAGDWTALMKSYDHY